MVGKTKLVLGLLATALIISAIFVVKTCNKNEPIQPRGTTAGGTMETLQSSSTTGVETKETAIPSPIKNTERMGASEDSQLEKKIVDVLMRNPEIIVGALQKFSQNQQRAQQEKLEASFMKYKNDISKDSSAAILGNKDAEVKLVVFLDPNCPHCRPFSQALHKVRKEFPNVAIFVRQWPILGPVSEEVSRGLWTIKQQGQDKFNAAMKAIDTSEERYTLAKLLSWVETQKLDIPKFKADLESQATKDVIEETIKLAKDIGLEGTPSSLLVNKNGVQLVTPTDEKSLQSILKTATQETAPNARLS